MKALSPVRPGAETPAARVLVRKRVELWRRAYERGDAAVLAQAVAEQRMIPVLLRASLDQFDQRRAA
ncbi:MAG TPA: hypothetical protein VLK36_08855 [Gaiellaceae bacterium]|nr:hypothetical protein [Gaiellaceae bacterium]